MHCAPSRRSRVRQAFEIKAPVYIAKEASSAVVTTLNHMQRHTRQL